MPLSTVRLILVKGMCTLEPFIIVSKVMVLLPVVSRLARYFVASQALAFDVNLLPQFAASLPVDY